MPGRIARLGEAFAIVLLVVRGDAVDPTDLRLWRSRVEEALVFELKRAGTSLRQDAVIRRSL